MAEIKDWAITGSGNQSTPPDGWPETTMTSADVNNTGREGMAVVARAWLDAVEGDGDSAGISTAYTLATNRSISANYDGLRVGFHAHVACGAVVTLKVDSGAIATVKKRHDVDLAANDIEIHQYVECVYSASDTTWQLITPVATATTGIANLVEDTAPQLGAALDTNSFAINHSEGTAVASATTTNIWAANGNTVHITGTTQIDDFTDAAAVGMSRWIIFDNVLTLTHGASTIILPGSASITTAAGDMAHVYADAVDNFRVTYFPANGQAVAGSSALTWIATTTATASANLTFPAADITSTYASYALVFSDILPTNDGELLTAEISTATTFNVGASDYSYATYGLSSNSALLQETRSAGDTRIELTDDSSTIGFASGEGVSGVLYLHNPTSATEPTSLSGNLVHGGTGGASIGMTVVGRYIAAVEANDGIRFLMDTGTIASGNIRLYGISNS